MPHMILQALPNYILQGIVFSVQVSLQEKSKGSKSKMRKEVQALEFPSEHWPVAEGTPCSLGTEQLMAS